MNAPGALAGGTPPARRATGRVPHSFLPEQPPQLRPAPSLPGPPPGPGPVRRLVRRLGSFTVQALVTAVAVLWLVPTLGLAVASLRTVADNSATGWWTALTRPGQLTLENYATLLANDSIVQSLGHSVLITVPSTVLVVALGACAAYALAWLDFPGRDWLFLVMVVLIVVPVQVAIIPNARLFGAIGIYGHLVGVVAFHVAFGLPLAVFLLRNFFRTIPSELVSAARLDGASELAVFRWVVLPLARPALASLAVFQFLWVWNDLLVALVFASSSSAPLTYALQEQLRAFSSNIDVIAPGAFVSMLVPLVVFFAFQRSFVHGALAGSTR